MGDSIGEKVKRCRKLSREPWVHVGAHCQALSEAADECERLQTKGEHVCCELGNAMMRVARLEEALRFYADPGTYFAIGFMADAPCGEFEDDFDEEYDDPDMTGPRPGKRARRALAEETP